MALEDSADQIDHAFTRPDLKGRSYENVFAGAVSFLRRRYTKDLRGAQIAVTGIPFDQAVTHRPGTRFGPRAIREASLLQTADRPFGWDIDLMEEVAIADYGDMAFDYAAPGDLPDRIARHIGGILDQGAAPVTLGGDHSITLGCLRAISARHGPLAVIQFDAHCDLWGEGTPGRVDHGDFMLRAIREGLVLPEASAQVGIRTEVPDAMGLSIIDAREVHRLGPEAVARQLRARVGARPCYVTFDIDALDPAHAPGTGTPVWGGLTSHQAAVMLRALAGVDLKGGDVVEVSPPYDHGGMTAIAGAHVAVELMCLWAFAHRQAG